MDVKTAAILNSLRDAPLLAGRIGDVDVFDRNLFRTQDFDPAVCLNFDQKLGHIYEDAMKAMIAASPSLDLIADHVQIFDFDKRTIGELDFIVFDRTRGRYVHLEIAVKFYLGLLRDGQWIFPGPNASDSWAKKLDRMVSHQFRLLERPETKKALQDQFGIHCIHTEQLIYGRLFYPWDSDERYRPGYVSDLVRMGKWVRVSDFQKALPEFEYGFLVDKPMWPIDFYAPDYERVLSSINLETIQSLSAERCTMFLHSNAQDLWFVVPDDWAVDLVI